MPTILYTTGRGAKGIALCESASLKAAQGISSPSRNSAKAQADSAAGRPRALAHRPGGFPSLHSRSDARGPASQCRVRCRGLPIWRGQPPINPYFSVLSRGPSLPIPLTQNGNLHFTLCFQGCGDFHASKIGEPPRKTFHQTDDAWRKKSPAGGRGIAPLGMTASSGLRHLHRTYCLATKINRRILRFVFSRRQISVCRIANFHRAKTEHMRRA